MLPPKGDDIVQQANQTPDQPSVREHSSTGGWSDAVIYAKKQCTNLRPLRSPTANTERRQPRFRPKAIAPSGNQPNSKLPYLTVSAAPVTLVLNLDADIRPLLYSYDNYYNHTLKS